MIDYSDCAKSAPKGNNPSDFQPIPHNKVSAYFKSEDSANSPQPMWRQNTTMVHYGPGADVNTTICSLTFNMPEDIGPPVLFYYRLTNFYQNHRRYVKSLDTSQLQGVAVSSAMIDKGSCTPLRLDANGKPYYPCGLIANSLFNDTFNSPIRVGSADNKTYAMANKGIAWESDKSLYGPTKYKIDEIAVPPNWVKRWPKGYTEDHPPPNLKDDEEFQVWMRTAGLPAFSKLALRNDNEPMTSGMYQVDIGLSTHDRCRMATHADITADFPVTVYGGTKSIVISTRTVMGGKNPFLGIAYVVVGGICIVLGFLFTATHLIKPRWAHVCMNANASWSRANALFQKTRRPHVPFMEQ